MTIAVTKMEMPAKSTPSRSSELRKQLIRIKPDSQECVLLFPDETADLAKLRNRASGATAAVRESEGVFFVTRTTKAVNPQTEGEEPETCVGIWKLSKDPNEGKPARKPRAKKDDGAKPANPKASDGTAAKAQDKADTTPAQGVLDSLS